MHCESLALDFRLRFCATCFSAVCISQRWTHPPHGADGSSYIREITSRHLHWNCVGVFFFCAYACLVLYVF